MAEQSRVGQAEAEAAAAEVLRRESVVAEAQRAVDQAEKVQRDHWHESRRRLEECRVGVNKAAFNFEQELRATHDLYADSDETGQVALHEVNGCFDPAIKRVMGVIGALVLRERLFCLREELQVVHGHTRTRTHIYIYTHTLTHTHTHTYTHNTHTHTHRLSPWPAPRSKSSTPSIRSTRSSTPATSVTPSWPTS
jgi:hypothetical protein